MPHWDVPGADPGTTQTNGINSNGAIVGQYADTAGVSHGFLYAPKH